MAETISEQSAAYKPVALTFPQRRALGELAYATVARDAKSIFTRSDVLWRLEERGLVARSLFDQWRITPAGEQAYRACMGWDE